MKKFRRLRRKFVVHDVRFNFERESVIKSSLREDWIIKIDFVISSLIPSPIDIRLSFSRNCEEYATGYVESN